MLTQLTPEQISKFWDVIRFAIEESLPPIAHDHPDKMGRVLGALLSGRAQCWASYIRNKENIKFEAIVVTRIIYDDISGTKNLLIYCLYGFREINKDSWMRGLLSLLKFAKGKGCLQVIAYTNIPYVVKKVESLSGSSSYTFIRFDVDKLVK